MRQMMKSTCHIITSLNESPTPLKGKSPNTNIADGSIGRMVP